MYEKRLPLLKPDDDVKREATVRMPELYLYDEDPLVRLDLLDPPPRLPKREAVRIT